MQSTFPLHVGVIMDGNGRWASTRGLPRAVGHEAGADAIAPVARAAAAFGVRTLTLYAFSSDNWRRPKAEVNALMALMQRRIGHETRALAQNDVRLNVIGRRDRIPAGVRAAIDAAEAESAARRGLHLRIAFDYSAREAIASAAASAGPTPTAAALGRILCGDAGAVDLLVRTGGEKRLSDFLLFECAYAELLFVDTAWPDFGAEGMLSALATFESRTRRFGGLVAA